MKTENIFYFIGSKTQFSCTIQCQQCQAETTSGKRCSNRTCIDKYCWIHLRKIKHLRIKKSLLLNAGRGLFADDGTKSQDIVFKKNDRILSNITLYNGEKVTGKELDKRYGDDTAPYGIGMGSVYEDGACVRGAGSMANHSPKQANAKLSFDSKNKVFSVKATKNIKNGQEIYVNYGRDYKFESNVKHFEKRRTKK